MTFRFSQSALRRYTLNTSSSTTTIPTTRPLLSDICIKSDLYLVHIRIQKAQYSTIKKLKDKINPEAMEAVKQTIAQNMGVGGAHTMAPEDQQFDLKDTPDMKGKVAVVTGGSQGIGYGATYTLLSKGIDKIFVISVSKEHIDESTKVVKEEMGEETANKITWFSCDIADWKAVKETADKIAKATDRIDILINNAGRGIMTYQLTEYGVDRHVCMNQIGYASFGLTTGTDGNESHDTCYPDIPPITHHKKNCYRFQHCPDCQPSFECAPRDDIRHKIRIA